MPIWVGPQAPGYTHGPAISTDSGTASSQGVTEAQSAAAAMANLGLYGGVVYYDLEHYNGSYSSAIGAFINSWVLNLHAAGYSAGVYGSPYNYADWLPANPPDDVWIAKYNGVATVTGLSPLPDGYWSSDQRIHQYAGNVTETYGDAGGTSTLTIDRDWIDGLVSVYPTPNCSCTATKVNAGNSNQRARDLKLSWFGTN